MRTLGFIAMLAATSMATQYWSTKFTGPSLNLDDTGVFATTAGTASWEIKNNDGAD